ncbi:MAG: VPLPA-CTERM sorting domain-containing protein [Pseudomonadota bacterium]
MKTSILRALCAGILGLNATWASAASLGLGESADFRIDLSGQGALVLERFGASCNDAALCDVGNGGLLSIGESLGFAVGTVRGADDLFAGGFTATASNVDAFSRSMQGDLTIAASVTELFLRVTAVNAPITVTGANLSTFDGGFSVFNGVELSPTPVPLPASGLVLVGGLAAFAVMRRRTAKKDVAHV